MLDTLVVENVTLTPGKRQTKHVETPSEERINSLFTQLKLSGSKAAVLRIVPGCSEDFVPNAANPQFPTVLTDLYSEEQNTLTLDELVKKSEEVIQSIIVTEKEARCVEEATRPQSKSKLWNRFRSGRLTASVIKRICRTNVNKPSHSLIRTVCYPEANAFRTNATQWGIKNESNAKKAYCQMMEESHDNFRITESGFVINPQFPLLGATSVIEKGTQFSTQCVFPELLGKFYTKSRLNLNVMAEIQNTSQNTADGCSVDIPHSDHDSATYCFCKGPEEDTMIACDNENCEIEWFHIRCLKMKRVPKGQWYCPDCRKRSKCKK